MLGIITEKPSARRNFAKALGGDKGKFNNEEYLLVNLRGHLYQYIEPGKQVSNELQEKYSRWYLDNLPWDYDDFKWKRSKISGTSQLISDVKKELSKCDELVIATDFDAITGEGFLLATELLEETGLINKKNVKLSRMIFIDETPTTIQKAFKNREVIKDLYEYPEYKKSMFRSRWDFMSQQFTRVASAFCPRKLGIPRQGRLKSYIVYEIGKAWDDVNAHVDKKFFQNRFIDENDNIYINNKEPKYDTKEEVPNDKYKKSTVTKESEKIKKSPPPKMYDIAKLSGVLTTSGYSVSQIKDTYQKMYEASILSYPRTSDSTITLEQFNELLPKVDLIAGLVGVDPSLLTYRKPRNSHVKEGGSHGANRPGSNIPKNTLQIEKHYGKLGVRIYTILAKSFLAILAPDYEYTQQKGYVTDYPDFKTTVNIPKFAGWKAVLGDLDVDDEELAGKELGKNAEPIIFEGEYPKPKKPTFLWLTKKMDKHDVGTSDTRASTIGEISNSKKKYPLLVNSKGQLSLTTLGKVSYDLIKDTNIANVETTEDIIKTMRSIGTPNEVDVISKIKEMEQMVLDDINIMKENRNKSVKEYYENKDSFPVVDKIKAVDNKGNDVAFKSEWNGHKFTDEEVEKLKSGKEIKIGPFKNKKGSEYYAIGKLAWQTYKGKKFYGFKLSKFANE